MSRSWPPLSVGMLAAIMTVLPLALFGWLVFGQGLDVEALGGGVLGVPVAAALVAGWRAGWWLTAVGVGSMALSCLMIGVRIVTNGTNVAGLIVAVAFTCWTLMMAALLWWPATRRWCGLLPPADDEDTP